MKNIPKTSIIVCAYDTLRIQRQITSACLANIEKYTDVDDYELILIDQMSEKWDEAKGSNLDTKHNFFRLTKDIKLKKHIGMSAAMNLGYKESNPDYPYIVFMHNDVFVWEGWLPALRSFMVEGKDKIIMPHQGRATREGIKKFRKEEYPRGNDDAGLVMMSKESFKKTGGWDERFKAIYMEAAFRLRLPAKYWCTGKCVITHIGCGTVYADIDREKKGYDEEGGLYNDLRAYGTGKKINYL